MTGPQRKLFLYVVVCAAGKIRLVRLVKLTTGHHRFSRLYVKALC
ncbi:hypothetical protein [Streptomyces sp. G-G2]|nr:hypothetical protein [Streptomyces sp. G-G2]MDJ0383752.1 hypothetical protein [Streptomyces sp. G-G2]